MDMTMLTTAPVFDLTPTDLEGIMDELRAYHAIFSPLFARREQRDWAATYLHGLLLDIPRKSIEPMVLHSTAPTDIAPPRLVRTSGMRWPIETCFEVGKQELGMGDYEVRSWRGWHHHMTLVILALGFLVRLQGRFEQTLRP